MQVGDLVCMRVGRAGAPGIIIKIVNIPQEKQGFREYAKVMWSDGLGFEKRRDLVVVSAGR